MPPGLAHGFYVISDSADFQYKCTDFYAPEHERCIRWDDKQLAIECPLKGEPTVSEKDRAVQNLADAERFSEVIELENLNGG